MNFVQTEHEKKDCIGWQQNYLSKFVKDGK